ncbi:site specific recombinase, phage integrase family protein [Ceratobasidium sp. AG-Ba]|nr:site specific recombinase, phage integrase family protein [Ceratobasidium sp. AG-Ba]QRW04440.1 site specific recombinase, phage integrase family protein [Ceratobasidium sp. AG-Ba]QRW09751.1 site specific recombinase, phage integrase family protein [Ceratobasidium sp. AG-Ba]
MAASSIANQLSGIKAWHDSVNAPWNDSPRLYKLIQGAKNLAPPGSSTPERKPVTVYMLEVLDWTLDHSNDEDCAILAVALIAFWCQCRLGELLGSSSRHFDPRVLPSRSAVGPQISTEGSRPLHLPRTKTHQVKGESVVITTQSCRVDPIRAINRHLSHSQHLPPTCHLFAYRHPNTSGFKILTAERFLSRCNKIWSAHGFSRITGHCFRIGGTTGFLKAGVPPEVVKSMGRWGSDAFYKYWRDPLDIAVRHAEQVHIPAPFISRTVATATGRHRWPEIPPPPVRGASHTL